MAVVELSVVYAVIGVSVAVAFFVRRQTRSVTEAILLVGLWPLVAPFVALERSSDQRLASDRRLAPTETDVARLRARHEVLTTRQGEIEAVLETPGFSLEAIDARIRRLEKKDATSRTLASARSRKKAIERLAARKKMLGNELEELAELFLQLETQAHVSRLAGEHDESTGALVAELQARIEALDEIESEIHLL